MEYILALTFTTTGGKNTTLSISGVKSDITQTEVIDLMDTILKEDVFEVNSGTLVAKHGAQLTARTITKYEIA